jgi:dnd system-associated protein 4
MLIEEAPKPSNWMNINVLRSDEHADLVKRFCTQRNNDTGRPVFAFIKDFLIFAAMVGFTLEKKTPLIDRSNTTQIILGTYASDDKDGFLYLLALLDKKDVLCLKDTELSSAVKVFEEYCNGGLFEIQSWLDFNGGDMEGVDTLYDKILEQLLAISNDHSEIKAPVSF